MSVNKGTTLQSYKPQQCGDVGAALPTVSKYFSSCAIISQNHGGENIVTHRCQDQQDQVDTGGPLSQLNFRDAVRGMLFGRKLGSHCLDEALQLFHSFCLELRFFFKDAAICISARRPGFVWDAEGGKALSFFSFYFFCFKSPRRTEPELKLRTASPIHEHMFSSCRLL